MEIDGGRRRSPEPGPEPPLARAGAQSHHSQATTAATEARRRSYPEPQTRLTGHSAGATTGSAATKPDHGAGGNRDHLTLTGVTPAGVPADDAVGTTSERSPFRRAAVSAHTPSQEADVDPRSEVKALREQRQRVWKQAQELLDRALEQKRGLTATERESYDRMCQDLDDMAATIDDRVFNATREMESATLRNAHPEVFDPDYRGRGLFRDAVNREEQMLRQFAQRGGPSSIEINMAAAMEARQLVRQGADSREIRSLYDTGTAGTLVPTRTANSLIEYLEASAAILRAPVTKISTADGSPMRFPSLTAHSIGTQISGQGTTIAGTDPTFGFVQLDAYKYGQLVQISSEMIQDSAVDMAEFLGRDIGRGLGRVIDADLVVGTGTGEPKGIMAAITGSGTIVTGGSLITPTVEKMIDLQYSVNDMYRSDPSIGWLMNDSTAGTIRKLRDGAGGTVGALLWEPSQVSGLLERTPDRFLGDYVWRDTNVASQGSAAKIIAYGAFNSYYFRSAGALTIERDDSLGFATDTVYFRGKWRCDGDLSDTAAFNLLTMRVS